MLDPFAGGSVRGLVAEYLGYTYTGIELRQEQVEENQKQAKEMLTLPVHQYLNREQLNFMIKKIKDFYK